MKLPKDNKRNTCLTLRSLTRDNKPSKKQKNKENLQKIKYLKS